MIQVLACNHNTEKIRETGNLVYVKCVFNVCVCSPHSKVNVVKCQLCSSNSDWFGCKFFSFTRCSPTENYCAYFGSYYVLS